MIVGASSTISNVGKKGYKPLRVKPLTKKPIPAIKTQTFRVIVGNKHKCWFCEDTEYKILFRPKFQPRFNSDGTARSYQHNPNCKNEGKF